MNSGALCAIDDSALALDVGNSVEGPSLDEVSFGFGERALEGAETAGMRSDTIILEQPLARQASSWWCSNEKGSNR